MPSDRAAQMRAGLPRTPGGEPWPRGGVIAVPGSVSEPASAAATVPAAGAVPAADGGPVGGPAPAAPVSDTRVETGSLAETAAPEAAAPAQAVLRRGLPRVAGGDPWPPAGLAPAGAMSFEASAEAAPAPVAPTEALVVSAGEDAVASVSSASVAAPAPSAPAPSAPAPATQPASTPAAPAGGGAALRRGLPRVPGGEAWPPAGAAPAGSRDTSAAGAAPPAIEAAAHAAAAVAVETAPTATVSAPAAAAPKHEAPATAAPVHAPAVPATPEPNAQASEPAAVKPAARAKAAASAREPRMIGTRTLAQWVKIAVWGVIGAVVAAGIVVLAARGVTTLPGVPEFLERFPGEYHPPVEVDEGFPAWARWTHFLNFFFMVLIVRTGLLVRYQQKPPAFYTPKKGGKKISLYLWLHTSIDILWLLNGVAFVVLLFVTNHWVRIVPTSWEVFPNALSAGLQYLTLDWPVENGWVNYNSLQQLMYFTVVFIAAPLAAVTGVRMSEWWPENAKRLNRVYPAPLARAIHFPVMLFFVLFVIVHVFLVLTTGALRNLNHMFAGTDQVNWVGFWWFAAALLAAAAVGWATRPLVLAPIANLFGRVTNR